MLPTHTLHDLFANHNDTEHATCIEHDHQNEKSIESKHTHCAFLTYQTTAFESTHLIFIEKADFDLFTSPLKNYQSISFDDNSNSFLVRGPPYNI